MRIAGLVITVAAALTFGGVAQAQATRTWVSGVGDDVNPCSRTAPCKTFAAAITKTAAGGQISVLDAGGFGPVTITKSISIVSEGPEAGIVAAGMTGVTINVFPGGPPGVVTLRGLVIEGFITGVNGVRVLNAATVNIQNCVIRNFRAGTGGNGVAALNTGYLRLNISDTVITDNAAAGVLLKPASGGSVAATLRNVQVVTNSGNGLTADATTPGGGAVHVTVSSSNLSTNGGAGATALGAGGSFAVLTVDRSVLAHNDKGLSASGANAVAVAGATMITGNNTGLESSAGATLISFGDNPVIYNGIDGVPGATFPRR